MARIHWWSFLVNEEGQPINNADISVYLAGSTTPAKVFLDEFSSESEESVPQTKSNQNGYFEFWVPDVTNEHYTSNQKFKIEWDKSGVEYGYVDYVDIYPSYFPVDENKTDTTKDKTVSNELAQRWESHALDDSHEVHGIEELEFESSNTIRNKTVSNSIGFDWEKHKNSIFTTEGTSGQTYITGTHATSADFPHGIYPWDPSDEIELTDSDYWTKNRLISHHYGTKWNDHVENNSIHGGPVDENDIDTTKNKLISNYLMNYVLYQVRHSETVHTSSWSSSGSNYIIDIIHELDEDYPSIQMWNTDTKLQEDPVSVESLSPSSIRLENDSDINAKVIILK